jgi:antitoxin (DNA-binding transcriptional repressor) of toxin-antitoxin stability system
MLVVSSREFRDRQKSYLDKVDAGMEILIQRGQSKSYKITPVTNDDTLMSKEVFFAKIDQAVKDIEDGKGIVIESREELMAYFDSL